MLGDNSQVLEEFLKASKDNETLKGTYIPFAIIHLECDPTMECKSTIALYQGKDNPIPMVLPKTRENIINMYKYKCFPNICVEYFPKLTT
jgi:hypothetical protein